MATRTSVFLDTSALFAGIWSKQGGGRLILRLAEAGAIRLVLSSQVISEIEGAIKRKAPDLMGLLAYLLDRSEAEVIREVENKHLRTCRSLTDHPADARILAAAWTGGIEYLVTLDRKHFLGNSTLGKKVPFEMGTPGDFISWYRERITGR